MKRKKNDILHEFDPLTRRFKQARILTSSDGFRVADLKGHAYQMLLSPTIRPTRHVRRLVITACRL